jgi:hypothetical protein
VEAHKQRLHAQDIPLQPSPVKNNEQGRKEKEMEMDFNCKECGHKLHTRQGLNFHMNSKHLGVRFSCTEEGCEFQASQKQGVKEHVESVHLGKRYDCDQCDLKAVSKMLLRAHKVRKHRIHTPMLVCHHDKCNKRTTDSEKMKKHLMTMHN